MWSSINGKRAEKDFVLNQFTALIPYELNLKESAHIDFESDNRFSNSLYINALLDEFLMSDDKDSMLVTACQTDETEVTHVNEFQLM